MLKTRLQAADILGIRHIERGRPDTTRLKRTQSAHLARRSIHHMSPTVEFFGQRAADARGTARDQRNIRLHEAADGLLGVAFTRWHSGLVGRHVHLQATA